MLIRYEYEFTLTCQQPTALVCLLSVDEDRATDITVPENDVHQSQRTGIDIPRSVRQPLPEAGCAGWRPDHLGRRNSLGQRTTGQGAA